MSTRRRRILSLSTLFPNRSAPQFGTFVARSLEALAARGDWDVTLVNPIGLPPLRLGRYARLAQAAADGIEQGLAVHRPVFPLIPKFGGPLNPRLIARTVLPLARRWHAEAPFDLVDAQFFYPDGPAAARIASALGLPLSIKARGADISHWGARPSSHRQMLAAAEQAAGLLAVSEALGRDMAAIGLPQGKLTVHYTGLDRTRFHLIDKPAARARLAGELGLTLDETAPLLAGVGALIPRKGHSLTIAALARLPDAHLALVGTGAEHARLAAQARSLGLGDRVHFLGSLSHDLLPAVLAAADAMVLPSASEGLANAWVEALACGTPIVIADVGGARELVRSETAGRIVSRDAEAIARGIVEVLAAKYPPAEVAANAAHFSWEEHAAKLAAYYDALLEKAA